MDIHITYIKLIKNPVKLYLQDSINMYYIIITFRTAPAF